MASQSAFDGCMPRWASCKIPLPHPQSLRLLQLSICQPLLKPRWGSGPPCQQQLSSPWLWGVLHYMAGFVHSGSKVPGLRRPLHPSLDRRQPSEQIPICRPDHWLSKFKNSYLKQSPKTKGMASQSQRINFDALQLIREHENLLRDWKKTCWLKSRIRATLNLGGNLPTDIFSRPRYNASSPLFFLMKNITGDQRK